MNKWLNNYIPAALWLSYHAVFLKMAWSFFGLLMFFRAAVIFGCFLIREEPKKRAPNYQIILSWIGTFVPIFIVWRGGHSVSVLIGEIVSIVGLALLLTASLDLGKSFGISPALRTPVESGLYRFLKHPLYTSYVLIELGLIITTPTLWNLGIAVVAWASYALRARWEEQLMYKGTVAFSSPIPCKN